MVRCTPLLNWSVFECFKEILGCQLTHLHSIGEFSHHKPLPELLLYHKISKMQRMQWYRLPKEGMLSWFSWQMSTLDRFWDRSRMRVLGLDDMDHSFIIHNKLHYFFLSTIYREWLPQSWQITSLLAEWNMSVALLTVVVQTRLESQYLDMTWTEALGCLPYYGNHSILRRKSATVKYLLSN